MNVEQAAMRQIPARIAQRVCVFIRRLLRELAGPFDIVAYT
jgi:hypothetical protein